METADDRIRTESTNENWQNGRVETVAIAVVAFGIPLAFLLLLLKAVRKLMHTNASRSLPGIFDTTGRRMTETWQATENRVVH